MEGEVCVWKRKLEEKLWIQGVAYVGVGVRIGDEPKEKKVVRPHSRSGSGRLLFVGEGPTSGRVAERLSRSNVPGVRAVYASGVQGRVHLVADVELRKTAALRAVCISGSGRVEVHAAAARCAHVVTMVGLDVWVVAGVA